VLPLLILVLYDGWTRQQGFFKGIVHQLRGAHLWLYAVVVGSIATPLAVYAYGNQAQFFSRARRVSVFRGDDPGGECWQSSMALLGMFLGQGDQNWRHNFDRQPVFPTFLGVIFVAGLLVVALSFCMRVVSSRKTVFADRLRTISLPSFSLFLVLWLLAMLLPSALTAQGQPHFLRSISAIPPTYAIAGLGGVVLLTVLTWLLPRRLSWLAPVAGGLLLAALAISSTRRSYFEEWALSPVARGAFQENTARVGYRLASLPSDVPKYVVVAVRASDVAADAWHVQAVAFLTQTHTEYARRAADLRYIRTIDIAELPRSEEKQYFALVRIRKTDLAQIEAAIREVSPQAEILR
jgi:hypothetical protein